MEGLEREYLYWLCRSLPAVAVPIREMRERFGSFEQVYNIEGTQLREMGIIRGPKLAEAFDEAKGTLKEAAEEYRRLPKQGIRFVTPYDPEYPDRLRHIYDYPMGLWIKGTLPLGEWPTAAVIGARDCTSYGEQIGRAHV